MSSFFVSTKRMLSNKWKFNFFPPNRVIQCTKKFLSIVCIRANQEIRLTRVYVTHGNAVIEFSYTSADNTGDNKGLIPGKNMQRRAQRKLEELNFTYRRL